MVHASCEYAPTSRSTAHSRRQYVKALEERVAQLEMIVSKQGLSEFGQDHWEDIPELDVLGMPIDNCSPSSTQPHNSVSSGSQWAQQTPVDSGDMLSWAMRDLSLQANGGFVGASAYLGLGRAVSHIVGAMETSPLELPSTQHSSNLNRLLSSSASGQDPSNSPWMPGLEITHIPLEMANRLMHGYLNYIPSRWPILHRLHILDLHSRRNQLENVYETFTLTFVYAIGWRYTNPIRDDGEAFPIDFFESSLKSLDSIIKLNDIRSVICLLLLSIFSLKGPRGPSVW
jgi:hypothetical protein